MGPGIPVNQLLGESINAHASFGPPPPLSAASITGALITFAISELLSLPFSFSPPPCTGVGLKVDPRFGDFLFC